MCSRAALRPCLLMLTIPLKQSAALGASSASAGRARIAPRAGKIRRLPPPRPSYEETNAARSAGESKTRMARGERKPPYFTLSLGPNATTPQLPVSGLTHHNTTMCPRVNLFRSPTQFPKSGPHTKCMKRDSAQSALKIGWGMVTRPFAKCFTLSPANAILRQIRVILQVVNLPRHGTIRRVIVPLRR